MEHMKDGVVSSKYSDDTTTLSLDLDQSRVLPKSPSDLTPLFLLDFIIYFSSHRAEEITSGRPGYHDMMFVLYPVCTH
jgi:hypothetical protein